MKYCRFTGDDDIFTLLKELANKKGVDVPRRGINCHLADDSDGEHCYGMVENDKYGNRLKSFLAGELKTLFSAIKTESFLNRAVFAYVNELPENLSIYLFWC